MAGVAQVEHVPGHSDVGSSPTPAQIYQSLMNIEELYQEYGLETAPDGNKHCLSGWVNVECPFCEGNPGYHLGYNLQGRYFHCWRCGWHPPVETLRKLLSVSPSNAERLAKSIRAASTPPDKKPFVKPKAFKFPTNVGPLSPYHKGYLEHRGFDPDKIAEEWSLSGTGPVSSLDKKDYKNRIITPIFWGNKPVSFQARAINEKTEPKYKACPIDRELIHHKHILYGKRSQWNGFGICVEGVTDVWRLGPSAFATFGIIYTQRQIIEMMIRFHTIIIAYDSDPQAQQQAHTLASELRMSGKTRTVIAKIPSDPADMTEEEASEFVHWAKNLFI